MKTQIRTVGSNIRGWIVIRGDKIVSKTIRRETGNYFRIKGRKEFQKEKSSQ